MARNDQNVLEITIIFQKKKKKKDWLHQTKFPVIQETPILKTEDVIMYNI
jgi:hypothetical protein